jgi:hypothetical protein
MGPVRRADNFTTFVCDCLNTLRDSAYCISRSLSWHVSGELYLWSQHSPEWTEVRVFCLMAASSTYSDVRNGIHSTGILLNNDLRNRCYIWQWNQMKHFRCVWGRNSLFLSTEARVHFQGVGWCRYFTANKLRHTQSKTTENAETRSTMDQEDYVIVCNGKTCNDMSRT